MIRIGIFARISQTPVSTLRYYDEIGLLPAAHIDAFTGYRYYTASQFERLLRIMALKDIGLSLQEIQTLLEQDLPMAELRGMLRLKQAELRQQLQAEQERLRRLENWLVQIEQEQTMPTYEIVIKKVETVRVAGLRDIIETYSSQGALWDVLDAYLERHRARVSPPGITVYYQEEPIDVEVCIPLDESTNTAGLPDEGRVRVHPLEGIEQAAATIHSGPLQAIGEAYRSLVGWIERNGYQIAGPVREVYLKGPQAHSQTDPGVVVEIQAPVTKA